MFFYALQLHHQSLGRESALYMRLSVGLSVNVGQWLSKCSPEPAASESLGDLLEMQILRLHPRNTKTLGVVPNKILFNKPSGVSDAHSRFKNH